MDPALGRILLDDLRPAHVDRPFRKLRSSPELSPATVKRIHATLNSALNRAVKQRLLMSNPAAHVELESAQRPELNIWSPEQLGRFLETAATDRLGALTGLRRGEAAGLRWEDVDLATGLLHVRQQIVQLGYEVEVGLPKTSRGVRTVALAERTVLELREHRARQRA